MTDTPDTITREETDARVAAALREAAEAIDCGCNAWCMHPDKCPKEDVDTILALIPSGPSALDRAIVEAVKLERERCARVAESFMSDDPEGLTHAYDRGWVRASQRIANAIRAGKGESHE